MQIDIKLLEECPELSDYQKDLIKRVDVDGETQRSVAKLYKKTPATVCSQLKRARKKLQEWKEKLESPAEANLDKYVFERLNRGDSPWLIIAEIGCTDQVMQLSEKWRQLHADDYWATKNFLNNYGLMQGFEEEEKPLAKAVKSLIDWLEDVQQDLNVKMDENEKLRHRLEEVTAMLGTASNRLDEAEAEIERLSRLRQYEELSEEERQALQSEVDSLKNEIKDLKRKTEELKILKARLEREVDMVKQVKADIENDIQGAVLDYMGSVQFHDVVRLYKTALRQRFPKIVANMILR